MDFLIFVTLGTQDKKFPRLLEAIQKQIDTGKIKYKIIVQKGCTDFFSSDMELHDMLTMDEFDKYIRECDLLITHGGVGSIIKGLDNNKKIIAAARLAKYGEHHNDHQLQIIDNFYNAGYILRMDNFDKLDEIYKMSKNFKPKKYTSNTKKFIEKLENYIDKN